MTSIFQYAAQTTDEEPEEIAPVFDFLKKHKEENIIPPIGIAKPELIEAFYQNMHDEDKIREAVQESQRYAKETPFESGAREVLSHAARTGEGFLGGLGQFLNMLTPELYESEEGMPYGPGERPKGYPTAEELREITKEKTGLYLEPKGKRSQVTQEAVSGIGEMFSQPFMGMWQKLLLPIAGQATKEVIKGAGGSEKAQEWGKYGTMMLGAMGSMGNAQKIASQALMEAENMIPKGLSFSAQPTQQALKQLKNQPWYKSGKTPSKVPAFKEIGRIEKQIKNGKIDGHTAMQLRRDINEARKELKGFSLVKPADTKAALRYLDKVDNALIQSMKNYGEKINPQWWNQYQQANQAFRITQRSRLLSDFIEKRAKPLNSEMAKVLFHTGAVIAGSKMPVLGAIAAPGIMTAKGIQITNRMIRSPILRNHYLEVLHHASVGNVNQMNRALEKFDKAALKEEESFKKYQSSPEK